MSNKFLAGEDGNTCLTQDQRDNLSGKITNAVWLVKKKCKASTEETVLIAGVCISPNGLILTSSHNITTNGVDYIGTCQSWKHGSAKLRILKVSHSYGLCLLVKDEETSNVRTNYVSLAESGQCNVNEQVYGVGHIKVSGITCPYSFVKGYVEYPCQDSVELPECLNDLEPSLNDLEPPSLKKVEFSLPDLDEKSKRRELLLPYRKVYHIRSINSLEQFTSENISSMHPDIPVIQIKNFHLKYCGSPVFLSSGHLIGIVVFKHDSINFAVHVAAIKNFLMDAEELSRKR